MAGSFTSLGEDIENIYITEYNLIDRYVTTGRLWMWGTNDSGQLGTNNTITRSSPVQTISGGTNWKLISAGNSFTAGIKIDGTLWTWGYNYYGQLGDNTRTDRSSPVQTVSVGTNWKQVSTGSAQSAGIKTDGTLWTWGYNYFGQLGDNTRTNKSSPVQTIAGGNNWKQIADGGYTGIAVKTDGTLWVWGYNFYGHLGTNNTTDYSSPVQTVAGGTNWKQVSADGQSFGAAAIKTDGTLWVWGRNNFGQLGDNTITQKSSPVQTISGGTNWKQVSAGYSSAAIKTDGTLWVWGRNNYGQLGDNTIVNKSSPVQTISGGTNWKQVSPSAPRIGAIKTDGSLWMWGNNNSGRLGNGDTTHRSSPVQTVAGGTNWKQVSCGYHQTGGIYFYDSIDQYPNA